MDRNSNAGMAENTSVASLGGSTAPTVNDPQSSKNSREQVSSRTSREVRVPVLKVRSFPNSRASSRETSPRSAISEAPSLATQAFARLANYRAGPRTFKPDTTPKRGLTTGDVIVFRTKGFLLATTPVKSSSSDPDAVAHILAPSDISDCNDRATHFEVIRQGQWVGFRSAISDRLLQAKKRGVHRLVFFSANLGTWEQWEIVESSSLENVPWSSISVTLKNRRMQTCVLTVDLIRVGSCTMMPNASVTPRSIPAAVSFEEEESSSSENQNIRRMSGLLVHEWLNFVEREKALRANLEARVEQAVDDASGLREWAALQIEGVRKDVEEEVELLLAALSKKNEALEDVQVRLTTRLRWGVALLEAKKAAVLGRRVLIQWRAYMARQRYARNVVFKLQERSEIRVASRALQAWIQYCAEQKAYQCKLRAAVRKMSHLKMQNVFSAWRHIVECKREEDIAHAAANALAVNYCYTKQLGNVFSAWKHRKQCALSATHRLESMACRTATATTSHAFAAWRNHVAEQKSNIAAFEQRCAHSRQRGLLQSGINSWRVSVDDTFGGRMQLMHAVRVMSRRRIVRILNAWQVHVADAKNEAKQWNRVVVLDRQRLALKAMLVWRDFAFERREYRDVFVNFIHARAERRMLWVLSFWRAYAQQQRYAAAVIRESTQRRTLSTKSSSFSAWRQHTATAKVDQHRVDVCRRRRLHNSLRMSFAGWRDVAREEIKERQIVATFRAKSVRRRASAVLRAFKEHAADEIRDRTLEAVAVGWHAGRLQARVLWAFEEAVARQQEFEFSLYKVRQQIDYATTKSAWEIWQQAVGHAEALRCTVAKFQRRRNWFALKRSFSAWKNQVDEGDYLRSCMVRGTVQMARSRSQWAFSVWRHVAAVQTEENALVAQSKQRLERKRLALMFNSWRDRVDYVDSVTFSVDAAEKDRHNQLLVCCLDAWGAHTAVRAEQRAGVIQLVQRRAASLQLITLLAWQEKTREEKSRRNQLIKLVHKMSLLKATSCFAAWRQQAEDGVGDCIRREAAAKHIVRKQQHQLLSTMFATWRGRTAEIAAGVASFEARQTSKSAVFMQLSFIAWKKRTEISAAQRQRMVEFSQKRNTTALLRISFLQWRHETKISSRNTLVMFNAIERLSLCTIRAAFDAWRDAACERRARRTSIMRFMQRTNASKMYYAFASWRAVVAERAAARDELGRCMIRKRLAFQQFKQWYWESFDEDLRATLQAMFEMGEEGEDIGPLLALEGGGAGSGRIGGGGIADSYLSKPAPCDDANADVDGSGDKRHQQAAAKSLLNSSITEDLKKYRQRNRDTASAAAAAISSTSLHQEETLTNNNDDINNNNGKSDIAARVREALATLDASPQVTLPKPSKSLGNDIFQPMMKHFLIEEQRQPIASPLLSSSLPSPSINNDHHDHTGILSLSPVPEIMDESMLSMEMMSTPGVLRSSPAESDHSINSRASSIVPSIAATVPTPSALSPSIAAHFGGAHQRHYIHADDDDANEHDNDAGFNKNKQQTTSFGSFLTPSSIKSGFLKTGYHTAKSALPAYRSTSLSPAPLSHSLSSVRPGTVYTTPFNMPHSSPLTTGDYMIKSISAMYSSHRARDVYNDNNNSAAGIVFNSNPLANARASP